MNVYERQAILRGGKWLSAGSTAASQSILDFTFLQLKLKSPDEIPPQTESYAEKIDRTARNFFRLLEEGKSLISPLTSSRLSLDTERLTFKINTPKDLLSANLTINRSAEHYIANNLSEKKQESLTPTQKLNIAEAKFFDPIQLSQATQNKLTTEEAILLIPCLGLEKLSNKQLVPICDPATGHFNKAFQPNMLQAGYKFIFMDPSERVPVGLRLYDPEKEAKTAMSLTEGTTLITKLILHTLNNNGLSATRPLLIDLKKSSNDHEELIQFIHQLPNYFDAADRSVIDECMKNILEKTKKAFETCRALVKEIPTDEQFEKMVENSETISRLEKAIAEKENLLRKFNENKETIFHYLKEAVVPCNLNKPITLTILWDVRGTEVEERLEISKTCKVARRVFCPNTEGQREDLVYRSSNPSEKTVVSEWKALCGEYSLSDSELATKLLSLHRGEIIEEPLRPFLSFLVVLLLGKEPAYDTASIPSNFIILSSVALGIRSFEEALESMPMIPQGAVAAKQYLLHVSRQPLDALARIQYKDKKQVKESSFLPTSSTFLGSADSWITVYDSVATTAIECCRALFFSAPKTSSLIDLKRELESFLGKVEVFDIPMHLNTFRVKKALLKDPNLQEAKLLLARINRAAAKFLQSASQEVVNEEDAAEQCAKFLTRAIDEKDSQIQALHRMVDEQNSTLWKSILLSELDENQPSYQSFKKMVERWNPIDSFEASGIDPRDYSYDNIQKMDRAWSAYFEESMSTCTQNKDYPELFELGLQYYRHATPYYDLVPALDPENRIDDEEDPVAKWAISYMTTQHPLRIYTEAT